MSTEDLINELCYHFSQPIGKEVKLFYHLEKINSVKWVSRLLYNDDVIIEDEVIGLAGHYEEEFKEDVAKRMLTKIFASGIFGAKEAYDKFKQHGL